MASDPPTRNGASSAGATQTSALPAGEAARALPATTRMPPGKPSSPAVSVAAHPRATRLVREAREVAGLAGFLLAGWISLSTHALADALLRAIITGFICQLVVWAAATLLCRHLITAELRTREQALMRALAEEREHAGGAPQQQPGASAAARAVGAARPVGLQRD
jgi:hypothetical protein